MIELQQRTSARWERPLRSSEPSRADIPLIEPPAIEAASGSSSGGVSIGFAAVVLVGVVMAALVVCHCPGVNGPWFWKWPWRRLPAWPYYPFMILAAVPVFAAIALRHWRPRTSVAIALVLIMAGSMTMKLANVAAGRQPIGLDRIGQLVESKQVTSYYTDAAKYIDSTSWLADYSEIVSWLELHTRSKPAGPGTFYRAMILAFGESRSTAIACGIAVGLLSTLSIPAIWWLVRLLTGESEAGLRAAAMLALCPGFVLFFPMLDPIYVVFTAAMLGLWHLALTRGGWVWAAALGVALMATTFVTYLPLVLGAFMLGYALLGPLARTLSMRQRIETLVWQGTIALAAWAGAFAVLWLTTRYEPIVVFRANLHAQHKFIAKFHPARTFPRTVPWDLADFALGAGWIVPALAIAALVRQLRTSEAGADRSRLLLLCLGMPLLVAMTALIQTETARVWIFLLPMLLLPASIELGRFPPRARAVVYVALFGVLLVVGQNMKFLW
jgi:hypothetical protein